MNLIINGRFLTQRITGVQRYATEVVKELDKLVTKKDNIIIACPNQDINNLNLDNIKVIKIGKLQGHLWEQISLPVFKMKMKYDLLTLSGLSPIINPGYWTIHDITFVKQPESFNLAFRLWYSFVSKLNAKKCKIVFTVSKFSKDEISNYLKIFPEKITVTNNAVTNTKPVNYGEDILNKYNLKKSDYFLSVGSQNPHKNQVFIEKLAIKNPSVTFLVVGGKHKSFNGTSSNESQNLIYSGYVTDEDLKSLYHFSKGFIFPSLYEGFGIPPLEAISHGSKKICVSDIPVFKEVYSRGVNFFDPNDVNSLILDDDILVSITDDDIKHYEKIYSWEKTTLKILKSIIDK